MEVNVIKKENQGLTTWSGGETQILGSSCNNNESIECSFNLLRTSKEKGTLPLIENRNRTLMILNDQCVLALGENKVNKLCSLEHDTFDGQKKITYFSEFNAYEVITPKDCHVNIKVADLRDISQKIDFDEEKETGEYVIGVYCLNGYAVLKLGEEQYLLSEGEQIIGELFQDSHYDISIMGEGRCVISKTTHVQEEKKLVIDEIPKAKGTFSDFVTCIYLANVYNGILRHFAKKRKEIWLTPMLAGAIKKVEKTYLTAIILMLGICIALPLAMISFENGSMALDIERNPAILMAAIMSWIVFDFAIINPLIYFANVPKPVKAHIKKLSELTAEEMKLREQEGSIDERTAHILDKYAFSGRMKYDKDGNRLDKIKKPWGN